MLRSWEEALKYKTQCDEDFRIGMTLDYHQRKSKGYSVLFKEAICWKGISIVNFSTLKEAFNQPAVSVEDVEETIDIIENLYELGNDFEVSYGTEFSDNNGTAIINNINFVLAALKVANSRKKVIPVQIHTSVLGMGNPYTKTDLITLGKELDELVDQRFLKEHLKYTYNRENMLWIVQSILGELGLEVSSNDLEMIV